MNEQLILRDVSLTNMCGGGTEVLVLNNVNGGVFCLCFSDIRPEIMPC